MEFDDILVSRIYWSFFFRTPDCFLLATLKSSILIYNGTIDMFQAFFHGSINVLWSESRSAPLSIRFF